MRMLFLVDDDITEEELLKKASQHFDTDFTNSEGFMSNLNSRKKNSNKKKWIVSVKNSVEIKTVKTAVLKRIKQEHEIEMAGSKAWLSRKRKRTCSETLKEELKKNKSNVKDMGCKSCVSSKNVNVLTDSCTAEEVHAGNSVVTGAKKAVPKLIQDSSSTKQKLQCESLNASRGNRKRISTLQSSVLNEKKAIHSAAKTDHVDFCDQVNPATGQQNGPGAKGCTNSCAKTSSSILEDSCLSSDSELSESRRPTDNCLTDEKDCTLVFGNLFSDEDRDKDHVSLVAWPKDESLNPICLTSPGIKDLNLPDWMYVALDCEMVGTGPKGKTSVLARCSIVDYSGSVLYDSYIKPAEVITDYRTRWSGIRSCHMANAEPVQQALPIIQLILKNKVMIGHAVYNDFKVLGLKPEHYMVRDTAQCHALVEMAGLEGRGNSLKKLCQVLLNRYIQIDSRGHCSVEDARATLDLFKLVRKDWEHELSKKWMRKDPEIPRKLSEHVEKCAIIHQHEDFLQDKFWPTDVID